MTHGTEKVRGAVRERYGRIAADEEVGCCEPMCCGPEAAGERATARDAGSTADAGSAAEALGYSAAELAELPEGSNLGLGCGNPAGIAGLQPGETVVDLGAGAGIDCFLAANRVGPEGSVVGVDMTPEMVARARATAEREGIENVEFRLGEIEALPVADGVADVVISNCVLNLSPERSRALDEALRVLRSGGRVVISDLVSDRPVPEVVAGSLDAVAGCLPTARERYLEEFRAAGFAEVRITSEVPYPPEYLLGNEDVTAFLDGHPEARTELEVFASSIHGAIIEAVRA